MVPFKKIRYNCNRASFLVERKLADKLPLTEKAELYIHLAGCSVCRVFEKQSRLINAAMLQLLNKKAGQTRLDESFKQSLQQRIEQELNKN